MVVLGLHGAMVADGYEDCEGDLLARVRALAGPGVVVGAELDPHCHLSDAMVANADMLVAYKEYPHIRYPRARAGAGGFLRCAQRPRTHHPRGGGGGLRDGRHHPDQPGAGQELCRPG
ncbi:M81 family metallopeptidase [Cupriavidus basilensis]